MKYYAIYDLVGVSVNENYPWCDTLFINQGIAVNDKDAFDKCCHKVNIEFQKQLNFEDVRFIGDGAYIGRNIYVDEHYGVRVEKYENKINLVVSQECNEWLVIALQLSLLNCNHTMIHAAALEKDGQVLLLPSWGGVGKTATVCRFIRDHGWKLLGDDLVIVGKNHVLPFLKPFVIYPYHKELFPELFTNGENHTVKNLKLSSLMSKMIPSVKRMLRPFPRILAYLRKHNPQSMRVDPKKIFNKSQLSKGGAPYRAVWLERCVGGEVQYSVITPRGLASKAVTVSSVELFASKLEAVYHMCGCGMLSYDDVFEKMHNIIVSNIENVDCGLLELPTTISITDIGEIIYNKLMN